jgi:hypothetical protein
MHCRKFKRGELMRVSGLGNLSLNWRVGGIAFLLLAFYSTCPGEVMACPNCKNALRAGVDRAYAASILFMLGMPFALLGAWGWAIFRMLRGRA